MDKFYEDLSVWVDGMCRKMEQERQAAETASLREYKLSWLSCSIAQLEGDAGSRRSKWKEINQLKYQKRHIELQIAFGAN